jgi:hypothetical protein
MNQLRANDYESIIFLQAVYVCHNGNQSIAIYVAAIRLASGCSHAVLTSPVREEAFMLDIRAHYLTTTFHRKYYCNAAIVGDALIISSFFTKLCILFCSAIRHNELVHYYENVVVIWGLFQTMCVFRQ